LYWSISLSGGSSLALCDSAVSADAACPTPVLNGNTAYTIGVIEMDKVAGTYTLGIQPL
jgi:hypothetical protein